MLLQFRPSPLVTMAGGESVWKDAPTGSRWSTANIEQVAARDPDIIVVAAYHVSALLRDETWSSLRAVQNESIRAFPGGSGSQPFGSNLPKKKKVKTLGIGMICRLS